MVAAKERVTQVRERPLVDHVVRMLGHYGTVRGTQHAGGVTYFAFLSFFPVLALAFFVVGYVSTVYPEANQNLRDAIDSVLPGLVGQEEGQVSLNNIQTFSGIAGVVGLLGVLYAGLGWVSALRMALRAVFDTVDAEPPFVKAKLRDLLALIVIGLILVVAVAVAGFISGFSGQLLEWVGLDSELGWLVWLLALGLGLVANAVLFFAIFRLLGEPRVPNRSLWQGAVLGAVGFEVLKQISGLLFALTQGKPAFQAFGIALILVVWINYFSRVVLYAACWAYTTPEARRLRAQQPPEPVYGPATPSLVAVAQGARSKEARANGTGGSNGAGAGSRWVAPIAAGGASALAVVAWIRWREHS